MKVKFYDFANNLIAEEELSKQTQMPLNACGFEILDGQNIIASVFQGMKLHITEIVDKQSGLDRMLSSANYRKLVDFAKKENMENGCQDFLINMHQEGDVMNLSWQAIPYIPGTEVGFSSDIEAVRAEFLNIIQEKLIQKSR